MADQFKEALNSQVDAWLDAEPSTLRGIKFTEAYRDDPLSFDTYKVTLAKLEDVVEFEVGCTLQIESIDRNSGLMTVSQVEDEFLERGDIERLLDRHAAGLITREQLVTCLMGETECIDQSVDKHCPPGTAFVIGVEPGGPESYSTVNRLTYPERLKWPSSDAYADAYDLLRSPSPDAYEYVIKTYPTFTGRITIPDDSASVTTSSPATTGATCSSCGTHNEYAEGGPGWKCYGCRSGL